MLTVREIEISKIIPYEKNPRINDGSVDSIAKSITLYGFNSPIIVDKDMVVVCGHTRLKAAIQLGIKKVPVIVRDDLNENQIKALRIAHNRLAEISTWNFDLLQKEIEKLKEENQDIDLSLLNFEVVDLSQPIEEDEVKEGKTEDDAIPEEEKRIDSEKGKMYRLGDHILLCGDSTKLEDTKKLFRDEAAELYLSDPPYNVAYVGKTKDSLKIKNDSMSEDKFYSFCESFFHCAFDIMKNGASFYIFHSDINGHHFRLAAESSGLGVKQTLYWVKHTFVLGRNDYHYQTEPCLYGWKSGNEPSWYGEKNQSNLLKYKKPSANPDHPTPKSVEMLVYLIKNSTKRGDIVFDNFGGCGSTMIACEKTGRKCRMIELDTKYCDVIRKRWAEFRYGEGCEWQEKTPEIKNNEGENNNVSDK